MLQTAQRSRWTWLTSLSDTQVASLFDCSRPPTLPSTPAAHEWLAEVPMALAYDLADWRGLALPFVAAFAFTLFLIGRELSRHFPVRWMFATVTPTALVAR